VAATRFDFLKYENQTVKKIPCLKKDLNTSPVTNDDRSSGKSIMLTDIIYPNMNTRKLIIR